MNISLKLLWTPESSTTSYSTMPRRSVMTSLNWSPLNPIPRVRWSTDSMGNTPINLVYFWRTPNITSLELSPNRGILLWLDFPIQVMFYISLVSILALLFQPYYPFRIHGMF
jgi:hypothetical protein